MENDERNTNDKMLMKVMYQDILPDTDYLMITLTATPEGKIQRYIDTMWIGFTPGSPKCEIREPSVINPYIAKQQLESIGEPPLIINSLEDLLLFRILGGHGIVHKEITIEYWPDIWEISPYVYGGHESGFVKLDSISNSELGKCRRKSLKTAVKSRDGHKCILCGEQENLTLHHILWREWGGRTNKNNLVTLCQKCHNKFHKNAKTICDEGLYTRIGVNKYIRQDSKKFWESVDSYGTLMCSAIGC